MCKSFPTFDTLKMVQFGEVLTCLNHYLYPKSGFQNWGGTITNFQVNDLPIYLCLCACLRMMKPVVLFMVLVMVKRRTVMLVKKLLLVMLINIVDDLEAQMWNILRSSKMSGLFVVLRVSKTQSQEWSFRCLLVIFQF